MATSSISVNGVLWDSIGRMIYGHESFRHCSPYARPFVPIRLTRMADWYFVTERETLGGHPSLHVVLNLGCVLMVTTGNAPLTPPTPARFKEFPMRARALTATGGMLLGGVLVLGLASPALAAPCDAYSGVCPSPSPNVAPIDGGSDGEGGAPGGGTTGGQTDGATGGPSALPFTGAELVLLTALGAAAVGGGTVLVAAGRRRRIAGA